MFLLRLPEALLFTAEVWGVGVGGIVAAVITVTAEVVKYFARKRRNTWLPL